jgi:hypothetical protein
VRIEQVVDTRGNACEAAGVQAPPPARRTYTRAWDAEDCARWVARFLAEHPSGTYAAYDSWARRTPGAPSSGTCRNRAGSCAEIQRQAAAILAEHAGRGAEERLAG